MGCTVDGCMGCMVEVWAAQAHGVHVNEEAE